jgi:DNA end-binding protein Ku
MRAIWTGALSFGLVNIPVRLYSATEDHGLDLDMLHKKDLSPIRYARICRVDGKEIPYDDIVKGYEYEKGDYVVLTDEDFKKANVKKTKTIDIVDFAKEDDIDTMYFEKPYYLEPEKGAFKAYALLREAIKKSKKVGVAKFVLRNREHLGVLKAKGNIIVLNQLRFKEEIREPEDLKVPSKSENATNKEIAMALTLIDQLTEHFKPEDYKDTYVKDVKQIIDAKVKGKKPKTKNDVKDTTPTEVHDIMAMLKKSLEKQKA